MKINVKIDTFVVISVMYTISIIRTDLQFEMEEELLSRMSHPNIIGFLGSGNAPRRFLVLEMLKGGTVANAISDTGKLRWNSN